MPSDNEEVPNLNVPGCQTAVLWTFSAMGC
jgi:hypothetical protein